MLETEKKYGGRNAVINFYFIVHLSSIQNWTNIFGRNTTNLNYFIVGYCCKLLKKQSSERMVICFFSQETGSKGGDIGHSANPFNELSRCLNKNQLEYNVLSTHDVLK